MDLNHANALVTGGSDGYGRGIAKVLRDAGANVWITGRNAAKLSKTAAELGVRAIQADVSSGSDWDRVINETGDLDILINNAGCGYLGRMGETETAVQTRMVDLNVRAMTAMTNLVIPYMPAGGRILNTSSIASFCPTPRMTVYGASKAYVSSFTVGLSEELKRRDITVTAVCPGPMKTEFLDVGSITGRSPAFEYLPYCDQVRVAAGALRAAKAGRTMYTPRLFYKFYRLLAKVAPVKLMVKFTKT